MAFGGGLARGIQAGLGQRLQKRQLEMMDEEAKERQRQLQAKQFAEAIGSSATSTTEFVDTLTKAVVDAGSAEGTNPEMFEPFMEEARRAAMAATMKHAAILQGIRLSAEQEGLPESAIQLIAPDPAEFVERTMSMFDTQIESAILQARSKPIEENSFFAVVDGFGSEPVRVTERDTPKGTEFRVGDKVVDATAVSQPIQKTQEINTDLKIPGLTDSQSGQELIALGQQLAAMNSYTQIASNLSQQVVNAPEKVGTVNDVLRAVGNLTAQVEGAANALGLESPFVDENGRHISRDEALESFDFGSLAGEAASVRRTLLDLVFLDLAAKGQTGRAVSDRDLEIFKRDTGIESGDPRQMIAGLARGVENNRIQFEQNFRARTRSAIPFEEFAPGGFVEFVNPLTSGSVDFDDLIRRTANAQSQEEIEAIMDEARKLGLIDGG